jgi:hypothetical protein
MPSATRSLIVRELLWLLAILVAALPLALVLHAAVRGVPSLQASFDQVVGQHYVTESLYVLVVLSCYLGRLGAYGAARLAQRIPQEARLG